MLNPAILGGSHLNIWQKCRSENRQFIAQFSFIFIQDQTGPLKPCLLKSYAAFFYGHKTWKFRRNPNILKGIPTYDKFGSKLIDNLPSACKNSFRQSAVAQISLHQKFEIIIFTWNFTLINNMIFFNFWDFSRILIGWKLNQSESSISFYF